MKRLFSTSIPCVLSIMLMSTCGHQEQTKKRAITNVDQLPRHTYEISGTVTQVISEKKAFDAFAQRVCEDIKKDLVTYDIRDKSTLQQYHETILYRDALQGNDDAVLKGIERVRELVDKPGPKLMVGLIPNTIIQTRREVNTGNEGAFREAFAQNLTKAIGKLPWKIIQEEVIWAKNQMELFSKNLLMGEIEGYIEPTVSRAGYLSGDLARRVVRIRYLLAELLPLKEQMLSVYTGLISANRFEKPDIWKQQQIDLTDVDNLTPVVAAVWDTGVDTEVFPEHVFTNPNEKIDGKDNDGNGFVDDVHGIAYTLEGDKDPELLYAVDISKESLSKKLELSKGLLDQQAAVDSPEASAFIRKLASLQPEEMEPFFEDLTHMVLHYHGTHVGGIVVDGNPYVRILVARQSFETRAVPRPMTMEWARKIGKMYKETVDYFKANGVRVVNMSWSSYTIKEVENTLAANGIGKDAAQRSRLARKMFAIYKNDFYDAIKNAPEILFVAAAGNDDNDPQFEAYIPGNLELSNILVVGAVDQAGDQTSFTSFGSGVDVYANGYNVESFVPGGEIIAASGTSMSSPQVVNLAAKLLALSPTLKTLELKDLILRGAKKNKDRRLLLLNPKRSVQLLKKERWSDFTIRETFGPRRKNLGSFAVHPDMKRETFIGDSVFFT